MAYWGGLCDWFAWHPVWTRDKELRWLCWIKAARWALPSAKPSIKTFITRKETIMLTTKNLKALVKKERGLDVEIVTPNPVCVTGVTLASFQQMGTLFVFKDGQTLKAIPVPFGLHELYGNVPTSEAERA